MTAPPTAETALVVLVPESESVVKPFRDRYEPSAAEGMPAHITLLYPFKPLQTIDDAALGKIFASFPQIHFSLNAVRRFPETLYLAPEPDEPFRKSTMAVWRLFPEAPPYKGKYVDVVPHLSVATATDTHELDRIASTFNRAAALPIRAKTDAVMLMEKASGRWELRRRFPLAAR